MDFEFYRRRRENHEKLHATRITKEHHHMQFEDNWYRVEEPEYNSLDTTRHISVYEREQQTSHLVQAAEVYVSVEDGKFHFEACGRNAERRNRAIAIVKSIFER